MAVLHRTMDRLDKTVIVCCSLNFELTMECELPPEANSSIEHFGKSYAKAVHHLAGEAESPDTVRVTPLGGGEPFIIACTGLKKMAAGSSVNVASVLKSLGISDIGIIGPIGRGAGLSELVPSLVQGKKIESLLLYKGDGTNRTVTVRDPSGRGSTVICAKRDYELSDEELRELSGSTPEVLVLSGVRTADLPAANALMGSKAKVKVFAPSRELLENGERRGKLVQLLEVADLVQVNAEEAHILSGIQTPFDPKDVSDYVREIAKLGPRIVIVTLDKEGAMLYERGATELVVQPALLVEKVVDTCGAGDVHLAAFVYYYWLRHPHRLSLADSLKMAAYIAASKVQHVGPSAGIPPKEEREEKLREITGAREEKRGQQGLPLE